LQGKEKSMKEKMPEKEDWKFEVLDFRKILTRENICCKSL